MHVLDHIIHNPVVEYVSNHPVFSFCACGINLIAALLVKLAITRIDPGIMDWIQIGAWSSTIFMAVITAISWSHRIYKKYFKKGK